MSAKHRWHRHLKMFYQPPEGKTLADVPEDLDQMFSSVLQAQADLRQSAAEMGVFPSSYNLTPKQMLEEFQRRDPGGNLDRIYAEIVHTAPSLKVAETNVAQAQSDLDQANRPELERSSNEVLKIKMLRKIMSGGQSGADALNRCFGGRGVTFAVDRRRGS